MGPECVDGAFRGFIASLVVACERYPEWRKAVAARMSEDPAAIVGGDCGRRQGGGSASPFPGGHDYQGGIRR